MLDFEGNNVSDIDQLYYLRRCEKLETLTLKNNPVADKPEYYDQIQKGCPNLMDLDDEAIGDGSESFDEFFMRKKQEQT